MTDSNKDFVYLPNAREEEQKNAMERITRREECPFCPENLAKEHKEEIIIDGKYWLATPNQWPYKEAQKHFLIISKFHAEKHSDLDRESAGEFFDILSEMEKKFNIKSGGIALRFGDISKNGGTVRHLHWQFLVPNDTPPPVRFKIGTSEKKDEKK